MLDCFVVFKLSPPSFMNLLYNFPVFLFTVFSYITRHVHYSHSLDLQIFKTVINFFTNVHYIRPSFLMRSWTIRISVPHFTAVVRHLLVSTVFYFNRTSVKLKTAFHVHRMPSPWWNSTTYPAIAWKQTAKTFWP